MVIMVFVFQVHNQIESQVKNMIINYRDDEDLQNLVDWVQQDWVSASNGIFDALHLRQQNFSHVGTISCLAGLNQY